jgi:hypothetical protein
LKEKGKNMRLSDLPRGVKLYGDKTFRGRCPAETLEQVTFFAKLRRNYPDTWGALAIHPRNEAMRTGGHIRAVVQHKAEGMTSGAADIIIPARVSFVCELKRRDHTQSKWQDGQQEYLKAAHHAGGFACVALGADAAWQAFEDWLFIVSNP